MSVKWNRRSFAASPAAALLTGAGIAVAANAADSRGSTAGTSVRMPSPSPSPAADDIVDDDGMDDDSDVDDVGSDD